MGKFIDLTGQKFNKLTVIERVGKNKRGTEWLWRCQCDCGNYTTVEGKNIRSGMTKSCGCLKAENDKKPKGNVIDITNQKFGHLTVIKRDGSDKNGQAKWLCQCDCGNPNLISVLGNNLRRGHTTSCGCDRRSSGEKKIEQLLKENNISFQIEVTPFKFASGQNARFDFFINNTYFIEYDGETHFNYNLHGWHTEKQLKLQQERDIIKNQWCKDNNIPLIRIPYTYFKDLKIEDLLLETSTFIINLN